MVKAMARDYETRVELAGKVLRVTYVEVPRARRGKGIGGEIITGIIKAAEKHGFEEITMTASRSDQLGETGYLVWPRYGFDGPIPPQIAAKLPAWLKGCKTITELFETPEGRAWWAEHGTTVDLTLKLKGRMPR